MFLFQGQFLSADYALSGKQQVRQCLECVSDHDNLVIATILLHRSI
jgi:hypothetical protein